MGSSTRTLIASCALGMRGLWAFTVSDPAVSSYYIGGFSRFNLAMLRYAMIAGISLRTSECSSLDLLEDDRAVRNIDAYEATLREELHWIAQLPSATYDLLASLIEVQVGSDLRSDCLDSAHVACAYVDQNFFAEVRCLPWTLAMGNIEENVEVLAQSGRPADEVAGKIWELCRLQCNRKELVEAISMFRECRWSTAVAEQLHGFGASIHKLHRDYGEETLMARTGCAYLRPLVASDPIVVLEQKAKTKLTILSRKQPEKQGGRQAFIGEFVHEGKMVVAHGRVMQEHESTGLFSEGAKQWDKLGPGVKRAYADKSKSDVAVKRARLEDDKCHVTSSLNIAKKRDVEQTLANGLVSRISACRFGEQQRHTLNVLWQTLADISVLRKAALTGVDKPPTSLIMDMSQVQLQQPMAQSTPVTMLLRRIAVHRDLFVCSALACVSPTATRWFAFMYATQNPVDVVLLPLAQDPPSRQCGRSSVSMDAADHVPFQFAFSVPSLSFVSGRAIDVAADEYVHVLPQLMYGVLGMTLHSNADLIVWTDFLEGMKEPPNPETQKKQKTM